MFNILTKKTLSVGVGLLLLNQSTLASFSESNFWKERQSQLSKQETPKKPQVFASLPSSLSNSNQFNPNSILNQMPSIKGALPSRVNWKNSPNVKNGKQSNRLNETINAIPLTHSRIQEVYDSGKSDNPAVVIIQDVHLNPEAQTNIAVVIQELINQKKVNAVGVEGAFDELNFGPIRNLSKKEVTQKVAQAFLDNKFLAAPSYVGITSVQEPPLFLGVDDPIHHKANVDAYLSTREIKKITTKELKDFNRILETAKQEFFSKQLKTYDDYRRSYQSGKIGIGPYLKRLSAYEVNYDLSIEQFLEAYSFETSLDFKKVDRERKVIIEKLAKKLDKESLSKLLAQSLSYRMGRLSFGDYYQNLKILCAENGIDLRKTPNFDNYIRYVLLSDGIRVDKFFQAINDLEERVLAKLSQSEEEKIIANLSKQIGYIEKLIDFQLTPGEWISYSKGNRDLAAIQKTLQNLITVEPVRTVPFTNLSSYEAFYHEAEIRSQKMVDKLVHHPVSGNRILVTGGFHTPEVAQLLKDQDFSYVVVAPKITKIEQDDGNSYLSVFAREKTPLERLFAGEKLFVNPTHVNVTPHLTQQAVATYVQLVQPSGIKELANLDGAGFSDPLYVAATVPDGYDLVEPLLLDSVDDEFGGVMVRASPSFWETTTERITSFFGSGESNEQGLGSLASIFDKRLRQNGFHEQHPSWYRFISVVLVNLENLIFPAVIYGSTALFGPSLVVAISAYLVAAGIFAVIHPDRSRGRMLNLFLVGLSIGVPFLLPLAGTEAFLWSIVPHTTYNAGILTLEYFKIKPNWLHLASSADGSEVSREQIQSLITHLKSIQNDGTTLARTLKLLLAVADNDPNLLLISGLPENLQARIFDADGSLNPQILIQFLSNFDKIDKAIPETRKADYGPIGESLKAAVTSNKGRETLEPVKSQSQNFNQREQLQALRKYLSSIQNDGTTLARTLKLMLAVGDSDQEVLRTSGLPESLQRRIFNLDQSLNSDLIDRFLGNLTNLQNMVLLSGRQEYRSIAQNLADALPSQSKNQASAANETGTPTQAEKSETGLKGVERLTQLISLAPIGKAIQILCVCTANINRSRTMKKTLDHLVTKAGLNQKITITSGGVAIPNGQTIPLSHPMLSGIFQQQNGALKSQGINSNDWEPKGISDQELRDATVILIADEGNREIINERLRKLFPNDPSVLDKVVPFTSLDPAQFGETNNLPDPQSGELSIDNSVQSILGVAQNKIIPVIKNRESALRTDKSTSKTVGPSVQTTDLVVTSQASAIVEINPQNTPEEELRLLRLFLIAVTQAFVKQLQDVTTPQRIAKVIWAVAINDREGKVLSGSGLPKELVEPLAEGFRDGTFLSDEILMRFLKNRGLISEIIPANLESDKRKIYEGIINTLTKVLPARETTPPPSSVNDSTAKQDSRAFEHRGKAIRDNLPELRRRLAVLTQAFVQRGDSVTPQRMFKLIWATARENFDGSILSESGLPADLEVRLEKGFEDGTFLDDAELISFLENFDRMDDVIPSSRSDVYNPLADGLRKTVARLAQKPSRAPEETSVEAKDLLEGSQKEPKIMHLTSLENAKSTLRNGFYQAIGVNTFLSYSPSSSYLSDSLGEQIDLVFNDTENLTQAAFGDQHVFRLSKKSSISEDKFDEVKLKIGDSAFRSITKWKNGLGHIPPKYLNLVETIRKNKKRVGKELTVEAFNEFLKYALDYLDEINADNSLKNSVREAAGLENPNLGSIFDKQLRKNNFHKNHAFLYAIVSVVLVNLENFIFPAVIYGSAALFGPSLFVAIPAYMLASAIFAALHPGRTLGRMGNLFVVGLAIGLPFVLPLPGIDAFLWALVPHAIYNAIILTLEHFSLKPGWLHLANILRKPFTKKENRATFGTKVKLDNERKQIKIFGQQMARILSSDDSSRLMVESVLDLVPSEAVLEGVKSGRSDGISWKELGTEIRLEIELLLKTNQIGSQELKTRLASLLFILKNVLTDDEFKGFVGPLSELLSEIKEENEPTDIYIWLNNYTETAIQQAEQDINPLLNEDGNLNANLRIVFITPSSDASLDDVIRSKFAGIDPGQLSFTNASDHQNVVHLLRGTARQVVEAENLKGINQKTIKRFLIPEDADVPADFFNLDNLDLLPIEREVLAQTLYVYIILRSLQYAVEISGSHLPNWSVFRQTLISA